MGLMSKILHKDKHQDETPASATATSSNTTTSSQDKPYYTGPQTNTSSTAGHTTGHDTTTGSHGLGSNTTSSGLGSSAHTSNTTAGPHSSKTANEADPRVDSDNSRYGATHNTGSYGYGSDNYGPHSSNTGNKVDPRVDSDNSRYNSNTIGGQHGMASDNLGHRNEYNTTSGPHASNMANKADPRVDSDNSRYTTGVSDSHGQFADTATGGHRGYDSTPGAFPTGGSGLGHSTQPHVGRDGHGSSTGAGQNFSGRDAYNSSNVPGPYGTREDYGPTGPASHTLGPHSSNAANVVDPRVRPEPEKMRDHNTVGPHQSDMLNKLDPRVDSDPRNHGLSRDPAHNDDHRYGSADSGRQTGGFVGGPHERLENRGSIPTAGGLPVGADGKGPYGGSHTGLTGSHGRDHQYENSHGGLTGSHGGLTGSHGRDHYDNSSSGLTGSHGLGNEPYGFTDKSSHGIGSGSHHAGGHGLSDLEYKEREIALRQKELDLKEREYRINAGH